MSLLKKILGGKEKTAEKSRDSQDHFVAQSYKGTSSSHSSEPIEEKCEPTSNVESQPDTNSEDLTNEEDIKNLPFRHFLNMEAVYKYQEVSEREHLSIPRSTPEKAVSFRDLFKSLFPDIVEHFTEKTIVARSSGKTVSSDCYSNGQSLLDHSPFLFLFHRNDDGTSNVIDEAVNVTFEYKGSDDKFYYLNTSIKPIGSTENSVYARLCILPAVEGYDDLQTASSNNLPSPISFVMIYDVLSPASDLRRFEEIERATMDKMKQHKPLAVFEDEVMRGMSGISYPGYNMGLGKWLLDNHRFYDAYVTFLRAYNCLKPEFYHLDKEGQAVFFRSCNALGVCLQHLGFLDKAAFYFQLSMLGGQQYIGPYVEVLALGCHNRVCYFMNQLRQQAAQSNQAAAKEVQRLEQVVATAEANHHVPDAFDFGILPLGYVLQHVFDADIHCILGACITPVDGSVPHGEILQSSQEVWSLNLYDIKDSIIYIHYSRAFMDMATDSDRSIFCQNNSLILNVQTVKTEDGKSAIRVNAMLPHYAQNDEKLVPGIFNVPHYTSFTYSLEHGNQQFTKDQLTEIFALATELKNTSRTIEAMRAFEYIHNALKVEYTKVSATDDTEELFFDATSQLGYCLVELGCYERATYYLDWAQEGYKADYAREYVNCLCNNGDIRALNVIDELLKNMKRPEEPEFVESFEYFLAFIKRRKVFVLINRGMMEEAETLLNDLKDNPISKDFAEQQLKYLKTLNK